MDSHRYPVHIHGHPQRMRLHRRKIFDLLSYTPAPLQSCKRTFQLPLSCKLTFQLPLSCKLTFQLPFSCKLTFQLSFSCKLVFFFVKYFSRPLKEYIYGITPNQFIRSLFLKSFRSALKSHPLWLTLCF